MVVLVVVVIVLSRRLKSNIPGQQEATYRNSDAAVRTNAGTEYDSGPESDKRNETFLKFCIWAPLKSIGVTTLTLNKNIEKL